MSRLPQRWIQTTEHHFQCRQIRSRYTHYHPIGNRDFDPRYSSGDSHSRLRQRQMHKGLLRLVASNELASGNLRLASCLGESQSPGMKVSFLETVIATELSD
jgi:hypothetical protein